MHTFMILSNHSLDYNQVHLSKIDKNTSEILSDISYSQQVLIKQEDVFFIINIVVTLR